MRELPKEFLKYNFKYVKIIARTKKPFQSGWNKLDVSKEDIVKWIEKGNNVGVIAGYDNLIIIDYDSEEVQDKCLKELPQTLMVQTGSGGIHAYYRVTGIINPPKFKILDKNNNTLIDVQGVGTQVLCPPSIHPNGNKYILLNDIPITEIDYYELKSYLVQYDQTKRFYVKPDYSNKDNESVELIKSNLSISDVLSTVGIPNSKRNSICPFHPSVHGTCFNRDDQLGLWKCWHCDKSGDVLTLISEINNLDIKKDFPKILKIGAKLAGVDLPKFKSSNVQWNFGFKIPNIEDNARTILDVNPLYYDSNKKWWVFDKKELFWKEITEVEIFEFIKKVFDASGLSSNNARATLLNAIKDETQSRKPSIPPKTWIQIGKWIYDIASDEIIKPSPEYFMKIKIPWEVGTGLETPKLDKLFREWVDEEYVDLYDIMAFMISPYYFLEVIFFFVGSGANGKGIFQELITEVVGLDNTCSKSIELLSDPSQRFQTSALINKLVCKLGDGNFKEIQDTKLLKELGGGTDEIGAEIKGGGHFKFKNTAKLIGCFNTLPMSADKTNGWYRRVYIKYFPHIFNCEKQIILESYHDEFPNLLYKLLKRLKYIYKKRTLLGWDSVGDRKLKYEKLSDPINMFIRDKFEVGINNYITKSKLYELYIEFALKKGFNLYSFSKFMERVKLYPEISYYKKRVYISNMNKNVWGRLEDVPDDLKLTDDKGNYLFIEYVNIYVIAGIKFKEETEND